MAAEMLALASEVAESIRQAKRQHFSSGAYHWLRTHSPV
jgi:hypothetical protein